MNLSLLNPQQRAAVQHTEGPLLLLAGAGSGKTRVITSRIAYLLQELNVPAEHILAVTFTNKASREMQERVRAQVGAKACKGAIISTFHSLGMRILREHIERLGYKKNFSIYAAGDQRAKIRELVNASAHGGKGFEPDQIQWKISEAKNKLVPPERLRTRSNNPNELLLTDVYTRYQQVLRAYNAVDFDDILMLTVQLLTEHTDLRDHYRQRFRYLMVDEYQDTNTAQYRLLQLLCDAGGNLCVVGDDDQSIYGWRGAEPENILDFEKDFPAARLIKLEQNYRSSGTILNAANAVIKHNRQRKDKALWTAVGSGPLIDYLRCEDDEDEARTIVERIHGERFKRKCAYSDFAILYRTNAQSRAFEEQLRYENIPYVLIGGQQFFDRKEVRDVLAYLQLIDNTRNEVALLRILNYPKRGIGESSVEKLIRASAERGCPLWEVLTGDGLPALVGERCANALGEFIALQQRFGERFGHKVALTDTLRALLKELRLEEEIHGAATDRAQALKRCENIAEVINAMAAYEEREGQISLADFLEKVSLGDRDEPRPSDKESKLKQDAVVLMSLHSSKGLEFPIVFLAGLEEDFLPHKKTISDALDVDEERRLCYVGITRAQRQLILTNTLRRKKYGKFEERIPSRFLEEIPAELLNEVSSETPPESTEEEKNKLANDFFSGIQGLLD
ncbi:MAG: UvrD-helicase domain-containing protein [Desulfuromonadales bacterium]|nr:UvrD-helicase domain-containing protein [Desulfuromonadales bacterium]